ncbi:MAG: GbsR/MarR family transcriptional regulator [Candidatus Dormibacteria bacterium]
MTRAQMAFIEDMGRLMAGWGIPRNTGRIYAYLLLQGELATLDEIAGDLGIAKSGASVGSRQLAQLGLARAVGQPGSRRVLYEALNSVDSIIAARTAQMNDLVARLRQGARAAAGGQGRQRLQAMADWCEAWTEQFPIVMRRLEKRRTR